MHIHVRKGESCYDKRIQPNLQLLKNWILLYFSTLPKMCWLNGGSLRWPLEIHKWFMFSLCNLLLPLKNQKFPIQFSGLFLEFSGFPTMGAISLIMTNFQTLYLCVWSFINTDGQTLQTLDPNPISAIFSLCSGLVLGTK